MSEHTSLCHESALSQSRAALRIRLFELFIFCAAVCVVIVIVFKSCIKEPNSNEFADVCYSSECIHTASQFLQSMDQSVDPCTHFYNFSCGGWISNSAKLGSMGTRFKKLNANIVSRLGAILTEPLNASSPSHEQKTKMFFDSCMNISGRQKAEAMLLFEDLDDLGGWPMITEDWNETAFNWTDTLLGLKRKGLNSDLLLRMAIYVDTKNTSRTVLTVKPPSFGMPHSSLYVVDGYMIAYTDFLIKIALRLNLNSTFQKMTSELQDAMEIEKILAKNTSSTTVTGNYTKDYNLMTISELQEITPDIPWMYWINSMLPEDVTVDKNEKLSVQLDVIKAVQSLLKEIADKGNWRSLANYFMYRTAADAAQYLSHGLELAYYDFMNTLQNSFGQYPEPLKACVANTESNFYFSLESTYAKRYLDSSARHKVQILLSDMKEAMADEVRKSHWMDPITKERALHKVKLIRSAIAYHKQILNDTVLDDFFQDIQTNKDYYSNAKEVSRILDIKTMKQLHKYHERFSWDDSESLLQANAFYNPSENAMTIPEGILQDGVYDANAPNYLHYGLLGSVIGHELQHAFDVKGSTFDGNGNYDMWWENSTWVEFKKRNKCFIDQYDQFYDPSVNLTLNGTLTLGENMADNGGLRTAYLAYGKWMSRNGEEIKILGLPFTQKQMFWVGFASLWCRRYSNEVQADIMKHNVHPPGEFRVNGAVSNMPEFADDFQCPKGSPMNPTEKCSLWN